MPWKESCAVSERLKFVARYLEGERMTDLCMEYEVSRKTGYQLLKRYEAEGIAAFGDQSRAPKNHPNQTTQAMEQSVVDLRNQHPTWGAPKIKAYLERKLTGVPAKSTVHAILLRNEMVKARRKRSNVSKSKGTHLSNPSKANELWCTDFKGQFKLGNGSYCYPLTVTDQASRFLLCCEAFENTSEDQCIATFHDLFGERGLPDAIRSDNGVPFASRSYFGLSKLSVFWLRLGIRIERIIPGHPEQNGRHERMHKTLKADATKPPSSNMLSQQERFDAYRKVFNLDRPHEALGMNSPISSYSPSKRLYNPIIEPLTYPEHDLTTRVTKCGQVFISNRRHQIKVRIGTPFAGYNVGLKENGDGIWQISFMNYVMGYFDKDNQKLQVTVNPFLQDRLR